MSTQRENPVVISGSLLASAIEASKRPHNLSDLVNNLVSRYVNVTGLETTQAFFAQQASLANRLIAPYQKAAAPMLKWINSPHGKCELFMYKRSQISAKFSKLVAGPLEFLVVIQRILISFFKSQLVIPQDRRGRRAQIMSIRGLALSCAPNFTRISDTNSFSRLYREFA